MVRVGADEASVSQGLECVGCALDEGVTGMRHACNVLQLVPCRHGELVCVTHQRPIDHRYLDQGRHDTELSCKAHLTEHLLRLVLRAIEDRRQRRVGAKAREELVLPPVQLLVRRNQFEQLAGPLARASLLLVHLKADELEQRARRRVLSRSSRCLR